MSTYRTDYASKLPLTMRPTSILDLSEVNRVVSHWWSTQDFGDKTVSIRPIPPGQSFYMYTDTCGTIYVNFAENNRGYNAGESLVAAIDKASKGISLTAHQEYAIEELWHEILHNKSCNTTIYPSIRSLSHDIMIIEAVNQLVARHTYTEFMQEVIGISSSHAEWILTSGYAYEQPVTNLRSLLGLLSYEDLFIEEACEELIIGYQNFTDRISDRLAINSGKYNAGEIIELFRLIDAPEFAPAFAVQTGY